MVPLIPRELLFGDPEKTGPKLSPDGKMLAYRAPSDGMLSAWVRTVGTDDDRVVARDPDRPIARILWRGDSRHLLYERDRAGDENYHVFQVDAVAGGAPVELTPGENVRAHVLRADHRFPNEILVLSNARDARFFDVLRLDLEAGTSTFAAENPGDVSGWNADNALAVRAAVVQCPDGSSLVRVRDDAQGEWRTLDHFSFEDGIGTPVAFSGDDRSLYVITPKNANASRLMRYDVATGSAEPLAEDPAYDVAGVLLDPVSRDLVAVAFLRERAEWKVLDPQWEADFAALRALDPGDVDFDSSDAAGSVLLVHFLRDDGPTPFYAFERASHTGRLLFHSRPALLDVTLAKMNPVSFSARDGLAIHGYLTLPPGAEPKRLPTVLVVHGGPWVRDAWGWDPFAQWLANRGYAVLQVNYRGSTGYGKAFVNAGNRQWAGTMRTDLLDARDWAIAQGIADPERFAIFGGSYGGYAVLAALTFTPDAFTCGVDIVGPSNLQTFLDAIPPYWTTMRSTITERMGEDPEFLASQSPLFRAGDIRVPLLIAQGANDPRVKQQESDQIVAALRKNDIPVTYVLFEDEGHGFGQPVNLKRFAAAAEAFFAEHLGGRAEAPEESEAIEALLR